MHNSLGQPKGATSLALGSCLNVTEPPFTVWLSSCWGTVGRPKTPCTTPSSWHCARSTRYATQPPSAGGSTWSCATSVGLEFAKVKGQAYTKSYRDTPKQGPPSFLPRRSWIAWRCAPGCGQH